MMSMVKYVKEHKDEFESIGVSSNEIRLFEYKHKKYILRPPIMTCDHLSPFWLMMKTLFGFTFEKQNSHMADVYAALKDNSQHSGRSIGICIWRTHLL